jgi:maleate isomerase
MEPLTAAMLAGLPDVSAHFSRFTVREISPGAQSLGQFDAQAILPAARLLADARVGAIVWSGTSAGWLGFDADEALCREIAAATGIAAGTAVLALKEVFARTGVRRFGLVTPYLDAIQQAILANFARAGHVCAAERHLDESTNFAFSEVSEPEIAAMVRGAAAARPDAIAVLCTNLRGARPAAALEAELGIPVYDSVALAVWKAMALAGDDPGRIAGWGRLFAIAA